MDFVCNLLDETTAELPDNRDANKWEECKTAMKAAIDAAEGDPLEIVTVDEDHANEAAVGQQTIRFNLDREPRFYAWVAFQGGYYEVTSASSLGAYADDASYDSEKRRLVCDFVLGGNTSRGISSSIRTNNYSPTGYLNQEGRQSGPVHDHQPANAVLLSLVRHPAGRPLSGPCRGLHGNLMERDSVPDPGTAHRPPRWMNLPSPPNPDRVPSPSIGTSRKLPI